MKAEIITIGNEILIGQVRDTNSAYIAQRLRDAGIELNRITTISDSREAITTALTDSLGRAHLVLVTGGLGPTNDDITKTTLADYFGSRLVPDPQVLEALTRFLGSVGIPLNEQNRSQALVPEGCTVIPNPVGTAPILWFDHDESVVVAMPGVPVEMKTALNSEVIPRVRQRFTLPAMLSRTVMVAGYAESVLAERLKSWEAALPKSVRLAYLPSYGQIRLRLDMTGDARSELEQVADGEIEKLRAIIGNAIFACEDISIQEAVGRLAREKSVTLSSAESCTGGFIGHLITSLAGSSDYYRGSVVAYANTVKEEVLGVDSRVLERHGAVSGEVAQQMAEGVRRITGSDYGVSTTGIAGPGGGTPEKPVGTVWIGVAGPGGSFAKRHGFPGNREQNIRVSAFFALNRLRLRLLED